MGAILPVSRNVCGFTNVVALFVMLPTSECSEAGSYLRFIEFVYQSTLGLREIKKIKKNAARNACGVINDASDV